MNFTLKTMILVRLNVIEGWNLTVAVQMQVKKYKKMVDRIKYEWYYSQADRWIRHDLTEDNMILERFPK